MPVSSKSAFISLLKESDLDTSDITSFFASRQAVGSDTDLYNLDLDATSFYNFYGTSRSNLLERCKKILAIVEDPSRIPEFSPSADIFRLLAVNAIALEAVAEGRSGPDRDLQCLVRSAGVRQAMLRWYAPERVDDLASAAANDLSAANDNVAAEFWSRVSADSLELYRIGTTSLILHCRSRDRPKERLALKLLLAPYTRVDLIADATRRYASEFSSDSSDWVVPVHASSSSWILMDFVRGRTLRELLDEAAASRRSQRDDEIPGLRLDLYQAYGSKIFSAIIDLAEAGRAHEDLTPSNIMIEQLPGGENRIVLLDLGRNYLFTRRLGSLNNSETRFVAPEVRRDEPADPTNPDVFSMGMLAAQLLDPSSEFDGIAPSSLYAYAPSVARIVEDMLDAEPRNRLLLFEQKDLEHVRRAVDEELEILKSQTKSGKVLGRRAPLLDLLSPSSRQVKSKFQEWRRSRRESVGTKQPRGYLFGWSIVSTANWAIIFVVCFLWGLRDFDLDNFNLYVTIAQKVFNSGDDLPYIDALRAPDYDIRDWQVNFSARIVGITTALAQTKYYQNIFSSIYVYSLRGPLAASAEVSVRFVTICTLVPVLAGNLIQPRWTLYLLAAGYVFIALNNFLFYRLLVRTIRRTRERFSTLPDEGPVLQAFSQWWSTQLIYSAVVAGAALGLQIGLLRDLWAYIALVCIVNIFVFYYSKCTVLAPAIRALLARAVTAGERLRLAELRA